MVVMDGGRGGVGNGGGFGCNLVGYFVENVGWFCRFGVYVVGLDCVD